MTSHENKLSVLMSTYKNDNLEHLKIALESLNLQTFKADEVILVEDGPLSDEHHKLIEQFRKSLNIISIKIPQNSGLGHALAKGLLECNSPIVARMDTDDIALPKRFLEQYEQLAKNPDIAIIGSHIAEFNDNPERPLYLRKTKTNHEAIVRAAWFRTPFNHMTVMFRRDAILAVGNYKNVPAFEDYDLWLRLISGGYKCQNMDQVLVLARIGNGLIERRSGWSYITAEFRALTGFKKHKVIPKSMLLLSMITRLTIRALPKKILQKAYHSFREKP